MKMKSRAPSVREQHARREILPAPVEGRAAQALSRSYQRARRELNARLIVSRIVIDLLEEIKMSDPKSDKKRRRELKAIGNPLSA
jgi:hypothetical protein